MSQLLEINSTEFQECISNNDGGDLYAYIMDGGTFTLSNISKFTKCKSIQRSGGGLYAAIKTTTSEMQIN